MIFLILVSLFFTTVMTITMRHAALPDSATGKVLAVFEPGTSDEVIFTSLLNAGGRPLRPTWLGFVWVVAGDKPGFVGRLHRAGASGAYGELPFSPQLAGCFAYVDSKAINLLK